MNIKLFMDKAIGQRFHFICTRFMQRMNWSVPQDKAYWGEKGWLDAARPWKRS